MKPVKQKIAINLVTWQAEKYLPYLMLSIFNQTFKNFSVLIIDNGSSDNTVSFLKEYYPQFKVIANKNNVGFAKAHNQAIHWTDSRYILCLNQDIVLEKNYLKNIVNFLDAHEEAASVTGKILQWDSNLSQPTKIIDSLGLKILKSHRIIDIGQGYLDDGKNDLTKEIFGVSAAAAVYRRSVLENIKYKLEYFDENFFSYKEDIDLAFRLRLAGCQSFYLHEAVAYHDRTAGNQEKTKILGIIRNRKKKNSFVNYHSYKNHLNIIIKNEFFTNIIKYFPWLFLYELKKLLYILFLERKTLKALVDLFSNLPLMLKKRKYIKKNILIIKPNQLSRWYE